MQLKPSKNKLLQDMVKAKNSRKEAYHKVEYPKTPITNRSRRSLWFVAIVSILFFLFSLSFFFANATVTVNPTIRDIELKNKSMTAVKNATAGSLSLDIVSISGEETKTLQATEKKEVSTKATGTVVLYNTFSTSPQSLSIDTRLEGSNGKIYKTSKALVIPGMNKSGKAGSVEATVYAAEAGEGYNSSPLDFKIFGFKGTPKYAKFYARSKTPLTGGFTGSSLAISDTEKAKAQEELKDSLKEKLLQKATEQIPDGFILFKDATFISIQDETFEPTTSDTDLPITIKGTLYGILLREDELTQKIAEESITNYDESEVYIPNIKDLIFHTSVKEDLVNNIPFVDNIEFTLSGKAQIVYRLDNEKFTRDLLKKPKDELNQVLSQYPNIASAELSLSPFWLRSLPSKSKDIKVIVNYPK